MDFGHVVIAKFRFDYPNVLQKLSFEKKGCKFLVRDHVDISEG